MTGKIDNNNPNLTFLKRKGNKMLSLLLDCVSKGDSSRILELFSGSDYSEITNLIVGNEMTFAGMVFQYLAPQIVRAAVEGGLPWSESSGLYLVYVENSGKMESVEKLLELQKNMFVEYAEKVANVNYAFSPLVRECRLYIKANLEGSLTLSEIAGKLYTSKSHLSHTFREETGETLSDFIRNSRIEESKRMIRYTPASITSIGETLGFSSPSHFSSLFHKVTGMTPMEFRNKYQKIDLDTDK
jgi:AraC-like DNA-binding protein